jgi:hypothetical protein
MSLCAPHGCRTKARNKSSERKRCVKMPPSCYAKTRIICHTQKDAIIIILALALSKNEKREEEYGWKKTVRWERRRRYLDNIPIFST